MEVVYVFQRYVYSTSTDFWGSCCWVFSCLILLRVEVSTKPGVIHGELLAGLGEGRRTDGYAHLYGSSSVVPEGLMVTFSMT